MASYRAEVLADNPLIYLRLGEAIGSATMFDESASKFNGTYDGTNPPTLNRVGLVSDSNTCADFDGTNDLATVTDQAALRLLNGFSVEVVMQTDSIAAGDAKCYGKAVIGVSGYGMGRNGANPRFTAAGVAHADFPSVFLNVGPSYHMVFTISSGNVVTLYLNGLSKGTAALGGPAITSNANLIIGSLDGTNERWDGRIDEVAIYGSVLSSTRVAAHFEAMIHPEGEGPLGVRGGQDGMHEMDDLEEVDFDTLAIPEVAAKPPWYS